MPKLEQFDSRLDCMIQLTRLDQKVSWHTGLWSKNRTDDLVGFDILNVIKDGIYICLN